MRPAQEHHEKAMKAAREVYLAGLDADPDAAETVRLIVNTYNKELRRLRVAGDHTPAAELLERMPRWVCELVQRVADRHGLTVTVALTKATIAPPGMRRAMAECRAEIWTALRAHRSFSANRAPSFPQIAYWFGVDHTTVQYSVKRTERGANRPFVKIGRAAKGRDQ